ncbi:hypothetical protein F6R98_04765 [Candidatus Methylospira mobilis]|uniref:Uncharacterized protein n=1 Tax=Candidatus Methylospira mobilis TaxID=1808979 RepID=A0A5Q0BDY4_9GAMM|nr:hypothetical protein [Candidatus Methylospira mobilis]QFY42020.1 hypothetical protein F6R98_04765 [Candidatus Methylospira mobilis]WNV03027.1 hypothetical protein RP726_11140 [Candidatus Methylospira mobilis]
MTKSNAVSESLSPAVSSFDGPALARICRDSLAVEGDEQLITRIQKAYPDYEIKRARFGHEWYRLGGIVKPDGSRMAADLNEWAERTFLECGQDMDALVEFCEEQNLLATHHKGVTLYLTAQTGVNAEDFVQIEVDRTQEWAERYLVNNDDPPDDVESIIDPIIPIKIKPFAIGSARYAYRRKTEVALFMSELGKHRAESHPAQRFFDDWNHSSPANMHTLSDFWSLRLSQHLGRHGEQRMNVEVVLNTSSNLPSLDASANTRHGKPLATLLSRFDSQAGYPFAWYFFMVKGLISPHIGESVHRDLKKDYAYLPDRDTATLRRWMDAPYSV